MDCKTARLLLEFARPAIAEIDPSEASALQSHLVDCPECAAVERAERTADAAVGRAIRAVRIPEGLRDRLVARLNAERDVWYRRRLLKVAIPIAASILLLIAGAWWLLQPRPARVDLQRIHAELMQRKQGPAEDVTEGFRRMGVTTVAPPNLNYNLLTTYHLANLEGRQVPYLLFVSERATAHVYILRADQFDLDHLRPQPAEASGPFTVEFRLNRTDPRFGYLIFYTGGSLEPFEQRQPGPLALQAPERQLLVGIPFPGFIFA